MSSMHIVHKNNAFRIAELNCDWINHAYCFVLKYFKNMIIVRIEEATIFVKSIFPFRTSTDFQLETVPGLDHKTCRIAENPYSVI